MKIMAMLGVAVLVAQAAPAPQVTLDRLQQAGRQLGVTEPLDAEARRMVLAAAKRVSVVTAVSPRAAIDMKSRRS